MISIAHDGKLHAPINLSIVLYLTGTIKIKSRIRVTNMKVKVNKHVKEHLLTILTIGAVVAGVIAGVVVRAVGLDENGVDGKPDKFSPRTVMYVNFIGDIFLRILKSLILPLIVASLISAVGSLDISLSKKIGTRAILYYMLTTVMAVILGIILVTAIQPGGAGVKNGQNTAEKLSIRQVTTADTMLDLLR